MEEQTNRRMYTDRRRRPTPLWNRYFLWGRRRGPHRVEEAGRCYVDRPGWLWVCAAMLLVICGLADAWFTQFGLDRQLLVEANPVMRSSLAQFGSSVTWLGKILLTLLGSWLLLTHRHWRVAATGLVILTATYVMICGTHLMGLAQVFLPL